jgi:hypothetical protein
MSSLQVSQYHATVPETPIQCNLFRAIRSPTPPVLPPSPPSFFPFVTVKAALAQLLIDRIVRLTHPPPKVIPIAHSRLIAIFHPRPEIVGTRPARIHFAEQADELLRFALLGRGRSFGVGGRHGVQEGPGGAAELLDVWRAV